MLDAGSSEELEAIKKLISKLPPKDLEKAVGGLGPHARNILLAAGALAVVATTGVVLTKKYSAAPNISDAVGESSYSDGFYYQQDNDEFKQKIDELEISETLVNAVGGDEDPARVFDGWTYYNRKSDGERGALKSDFMLNSDNRIYHKTQTKTNWRGKLVYIAEEKGVPKSALVFE